MALRLVVAPPRGLQHARVALQEARCGMQLGRMDGTRCKSVQHEAAFGERSLSPRTLTKKDPVANPK
jgi:hypothetical protein